jgi:putative transposase
MILRLPPAPSHALQVARQELAQTPGLPLANYLPEEHLRPILDAADVRFRERVFTPAVTLWTFVGQVLDADHSCRQAVARVNAWRVAVGLPPCSVDTSAYCKARGRLPEAVLHELVRHTGGALAAQAAPSWLWKGRSVKVVDGTGLSMPDTAANQRAYPQPAEMKAGLGFPLLRLVAIFSLDNGAVLDAAVGPFQGKKTGEVSLFRTIDHAVKRGDVLVADRLYATFWDVARARQRGIDLVMRLHAGRAAVRFRGRGHSKANRRVWWHKPQRPSWMSEEEYATYPKKFRLRAVRVDVRQRGFRTRQLVLITTLLDATLTSLAELAALYRRRWQVEIDLRSIKITMKMDVLRGKTPALVRKEVWAHLLGYNLLRAVMAQAAEAVGVRPETLSFAGALQSFNAFVPYLLTARTVEERARLLLALGQAIASHRVGGRPDRIEPRAVKRRPKKFPRLKEPRAQARQRLKNGAKRAGKKR